MRLRAGQRSVHELRQSPSQEPFRAFHLLRNGVVDSVSVMSCLGDVASSQGLP